MLMNMEMKLISIVINCERDSSPLILNVLPFYGNGICKLESFKIPAVQPFVRSNVMKISRI